jgi:nucleotide-binding universal stress UspA family protein
MTTTSQRQGSVVVGVDRSAGSEAAVEWAVDYATSRRKPLVIVNGAGDPTSSVEVRGPDMAPLLRAASREATDAAMDVVRRIAPELDVEVDMPLQDPRGALLDWSTRASMLVVGTRGFGPVRALLLGSVSTAVAAHASCPVAVVRAGKGAAAEGEAPVVVGTDGGEASTGALDFAFEWAAIQRRPLRVVHTWTAYDAFVDPAFYTEGQRRAEEHERALSEALAGYTEKYPDVSVSRQLVQGDPLQVLVDMSEEASLVVVGSRGQRGLRAVFGSVSRDVVELAQCTVVVVRP